MIFGKRKREKLKSDVMALQWRVNNLEDAYKKANTKKDNYNGSRYLVRKNDGSEEFIEFECESFIKIYDNGLVTIIDIYSTVLASLGNSLVKKIK